MKSKNSSFSLVWIFGPAASGKSTLISHVSTVYASKNIEHVTLSDLDIMIELVHNDSKGDYHVKLEDGRFQIINPKLYDTVIEELSAQVVREEVTGKKILVEISCGIDEEHEFNLSLSHRINLIPKHIRSRSKFIYVYNPYERRAQLNMERTSVARTPESIFHRFFSSDDFDTIGDTYVFEVIDNLGTRDEFYKKIDAIIV